MLGQQQYNRWRVRNFQEVTVTSVEGVKGQAEEVGVDYAEDDAAAEGD